MRLKRSVIPKLVVSLGILVCSVSQSCIAQQQMGSQLLTLMQKSHWRSQNSWFGDSVVTLVPIEKSPMEDTTGYTKTIGDSTYALYDILSVPGFRDDMHFDAGGTFSYGFFIPCLVGEVIFEIDAFEIVGDRVFISSRKYPGDQKTIPPFTTYTYTILVTNSDKIILQLY